MLDTTQPVRRPDGTLNVTIGNDATLLPEGIYWVRKGQPMPVAKFLFDKVFAAVCLILLAPVMLAVVIAIRASGNGPVLFAHERVGQGGRTFKCLKFRTMRPNSQPDLDAWLQIDPIVRDEWETQRKLERDPRVDRVGYFLRATSLDELPQFWNVLRGDMSIVGPRPVTRAEVERYGAHFADYSSVRPGITGIWQVSGRSDTTYERRVALDVSYVRSWSMWQDLRIVARTVGVVLVGRGAV
ncbi:MAG: sugar transferase [Paracoccaceae bacterium]